MAGMTTTEWWELAADYAEETSKLGTGRAGAARQAIARKYKVSEVTVARAASAGTFASRLVGQGRLEREELLRHTPVTFVSALARIDRYRPDVVDGLLPSAVAGTLTGSHLRIREAAAQAEYERILPYSLCGRLGSEPRDGYALRSRAKNFRDRALGAMSNAEGILPTGRLVRTQPKLLAFPLVVTAVAVIPGVAHVSFRGIRAYPAAAADSDRKRLSWALLAGSLGSRVFHEYWAIFEQEQDAWELSGMLAEFGPMGFAVAFLDPAGDLHVARDAFRPAPPDLHGHFRNVFDYLMRVVT